MSNDANASGDATQPGAVAVDRGVMQHTPGPWHWEADPVKGDPYGRVRYQVTALGKTVTRVYYSSFEGGPTNAEADAKLISAAPDLLDAMRDFLNTLTDGPDESDVFRVVNKARAAVAKATGASAP